MTRDDIVSCNDGLIFAEVDGEAVALNAARGLCYGLDGVGLRVLQIIEAPKSLAEVCAQLAAEYDIDSETCERDVGELIDTLATEGLVTVQRDAKTP